MGRKEKLELIDYFTEFVTADRLQRIEQVLNLRTRYLTVVLEDIYQPHNASAVLRNCDCFGVQDVHIIENNNRFDPNTGITIGSDQWLTLHRYDGEGHHNTDRCFKRLKESGYTIAATSPHRSGRDIREWPLDNKTALLFGTEKEGLTEYALDRADAYLNIPMFGFSESYNISVSVALCLYELTRRLKNIDVDWKLSESEKTDLKLEWLRKTIRASERLERRFLKEREKREQNK